jgi:hypothetical protein
MKVPKKPIKTRRSSKYTDTLDREDKRVYLTPQRLENISDETEIDNTAAEHTYHNHKNAMQDQLRDFYGDREDDY